MIFARILPPPPPHKSFYSNYLACSLLLGAIFFYSCDPPNSSPPPTYTTTISGEITSPTGDPITAKVWASTDTTNKFTTEADGKYSLTVKHSGTFQIIAESEDSKYAINPKIIKTTKKAESLKITLQYVTTVSGKIITPAKAADPSKGSFIADAEVRANPAKKVQTNPEGNYELKVNHSGTFTITANYTNLDGNYKQSTPQTVKTTSPTHSLDIPLNYGYTITLSGQVISVKTGDIGFKNGATVTIEVEGVEIKSTTTKDGGKYHITFSHPGTYKATASLAGFRSRTSNPPRDTEETSNTIFTLD